MLTFCSQATQFMGKTGTQGMISLIKVGYLGDFLHWVFCLMMQKDLQMNNFFFFFCFVKDEKRIL